MRWNPAFLMLTDLIEFCLDRYSLAGVFIVRDEILLVLETQPSQFITQLLTLMLYDLFTRFIGRSQKRFHMITPIRRQHQLMD